MVKMSKATTFLARARECVSGVFVPRSVIAETYAVPPDSHRLLFYYLVRFKELLSRHGRDAFRVFRGDSVLTSMARQRAIVHNWLTEND